MVYCHLCEAENIETAIFCHNCGSKLEIEEQKSMDSYKEPVSIEKMEPNEYSEKKSMNYISQPLNPPNQYLPESPFSTGQQSNKRNIIRQTDDKFDSGLYLIAFFVFPVGLLIAYNYKDKFPQASKNMSIVSIVGALLWLMFFL